ncbi:NADH dehydrogenase [ubiquinone] 1 alpha subcomplex subunit 4-like 2 isoform X1 [Nomascus leucogenys]|uniref:NADH dehydrogenase [ubiquinone] 1 alpha subcomplex subunit 4-like 2 isoform X1 n=1 Tax=Nomascus leucogenys TaxID=61853 RepID=UPI00122DC150|nr:NADH dehydrogenase [ubiquinone] 1 alpha subcomplex subunit 4-like 2 isoform X1 [Nomascus leucogenys]
MCENQEEPAGSVCCYRVSACRGGTPGGGRGQSHWRVPDWKNDMAGASIGARFYRQIKRHPGIIPMIGLTCLGMGSAALYLLRLALRSPDVCPPGRSLLSLARPEMRNPRLSPPGCHDDAAQPAAGSGFWVPLSPHQSTGGVAGWDRKNNPEPWNRLSPNDQYKFLAVSTDYKKLKKDRPDF